MYAINHAATALLLKKRQPSVDIWTLLVSVQLVELLWVLLNYSHIEYYSINNGKIHLDYLPYSHSIVSAAAIALASYLLIYLVGKKPRLAGIFAAGVLSHIVLDVIIHEQDIWLFPLQGSPVLGLGIIDHPWLNFVLEMIYGIACWWFFRGSRALLISIVVFNLLDLPIMLASGDALGIFISYPFLLPTFILFQILLTWFFVARFSQPAMRERRAGGDDHRQ